MATQDPSGSGQNPAYRPAHRRCRTLRLSEQLGVRAGPVRFSRLGEPNRPNSLFATTCCGTPPVAAAISSRDYPPELSRRQSLCWRRCNHAAETSASRTATHERRGCFCPTTPGVHPTHHRNGSAQPEDTLGSVPRRPTMSPGLHVILVVVPQLGTMFTVKPEPLKVSFWPPVEQISQPMLIAVHVLPEGR